MKRWFIILVVVALAVLFARGPYSEVGGGPGEYVVRSGDTLAEIATRYGVTVGDLVALNRDRYPILVERPDIIEVGWRLRVPGRGRKPPVVLSPVIDVEWSGARDGSGESVAWNEREIEQEIDCVSGVASPSNAHC